MLPDDNFNSYLSEKLMPQGIQLLNDFFNNCTLPKPEKYITPRKLLTKSARQGVFSQCMANNACFRHRIDFYRKPPFCRSDYTTADTWLARDLLIKCGRVNLTDGEEICRNENRESGSILASKIIRLPALENLKNLANSTDNLKILYLVRDPRGMAVSRQHIQNDRRLSPNLLTRICERYKRNFSFLKSRNSNWLTESKNFKMIRYEDFSLNPLSLTKEIYKDFGLELPENVLKYIEKATKDGESEHSKMKFLTSRNSSDVVFGWRGKLDVSDLDKIESNCEEVMAKFGYKLARDDDLYFWPEKFQLSFLPIDKNWTFSSVFK